MVSRKEINKVIIERDENIATVIMNDPEKRNNLSPDMRESLEAAYQELQDDDAIDVVITTGAGVAWTAGLAGQWLIEGGERARAGDSSWRRPAGGPNMRTFPKVTIAAVNGYCLGGGIAFLNSQDLAIASEEKAVFGLPEILRGFPPGGNLAQSCNRNMPLKWSMDMALTGDNIDARTAQRIGLVSRVVPHDKLMECAVQWAKEISRWDKITLEYIKKMWNYGINEADFDKAIEPLNMMGAEYSRVNPKTHQGFRDFFAKTGVKANAMLKWGFKE